MPCLFQKAYCVRVQRLVSRVRGPEGLVDVLSPGNADVAGVAEDDVNLELVEVRAEQPELALVVLDSAFLDDVGEEVGEALVELGREVAEEIRADKRLGAKKQTLARPIASRIGSQSTVNLC